MKTLADRMSGWLRRQVTAAGARGIVVGLSGGVDSAVVIRVAQLALPESVLGVLLPCYSDPVDEQDAKVVADHFGIPTITVDLAEPYDALVRIAQRAVAGLPGGASDVEVSDDIRARVPLANIKPRLRMTTLYFVANQLNYLVAGTGNLSELSIGYFTKYGDGGVDLLPLGTLVKSDVRALARELEIPPAIVDKAPSAGLWLGQTDEAEMGFSYAELERYLKGGPQGLAPALVLKIERLVRASEHKRRLPLVFDAESYAVGTT